MNIITNSNNNFNNKLDKFLSIYNKKDDDNIYIIYINDIKYKLV